MTALPEADSATRAWFVAWLERFAGYVREVDYAAARPLFHPDVLAFGTHRDVIPGLAAWQATHAYLRMPSQYHGPCELTGQAAPPAGR